VTSRLLSRSRPTSLALVGLLCVSLVAGCSSDDGDAGEPTPVAETTPEPEAPPPPPPRPTR
jgi:hypothetical protein